VVRETIVQKELMLKFHAQKENTKTREKVILVYHALKVIIVKILGLRPL
jgi:hypothetical protein